MIYKDAAVDATDLVLLDFRVVPQKVLTGRKLWRQLNLLFPYP